MTSNLFPADYGVSAVTQSTSNAMLSLPHLAHLARVSEEFLFRPPLAHPDSWIARIQMCLTPSISISYLAAAALRYIVVRGCSVYGAS